MKKLLVKWLFITLCICITPYLVSGIEVKSFGAAVAGAAILGVFNVLLKPLLVLLTLPITVLSLGFFLVFINAFLFHLTAYFVSGLTVSSFWASFFAAMWITVFSWLSNLTIRRDQGATRIVVNHRPSSRVSRQMKDVTPPRE